MTSIKEPVWGVLHAPGGKGEVVSGLVRGRSPTGHSEVESPHNGRRVVVADDSTKAAQERKSMPASNTPKGHTSQIKNFYSFISSIPILFGPET